MRCPLCSGKLSLLNLIVRLLCPKKCVHTCSLGAYSITNLFFVTQHLSFVLIAPALLHLAEHYFSTSLIWIWFHLRLLIPFISCKEIGSTLIFGRVPWCFSTAHWWDMVISLAPFRGLAVEFIWSVVHGSTQRCLMWVFLFVSSRDNYLVWKFGNLAWKLDRNLDQIKIESNIMSQWFRSHFFSSQSQAGLKSNWTGSRSNQNFFIIKKILNFFI